MLSAPLLEWQSSGDYFVYRGHQVFHKTEGKGSPLLLIHGLIPTLELYR